MVVVLTYDRYLSRDFFVYWYVYVRIVPGTILFTRDDGYGESGLLLIRLTRNYGKSACTSTFTRHSYAQQGQNAHLRRFPGTAYGPQDGLRFRR